MFACLFAVAFFFFKQIYKNVVAANNSEQSNIVFQRNEKKADTAKLCAA